mgnify:CR=1 FL=1
MDLKFQASRDFLCALAQAIGVDGPITKIILEADIHGVPVACVTSVVDGLKMTRVIDLLAKRVVQTPLDEPTDGPDPQHR